MLPAKLVRPRLQGIFPRHRLFRALAEQAETAAVWICGPAGAGKTTLVNSYLDARDMACLWYRLDESDGDIASFFYHLGRAADPLLTGDQVDLPLLTPEFFPSIQRFASLFFEKLSCHLPRPCAMVLDNYQEVDPAAPLHAALCTAIDALVPGIGIYICSRQKPPPALARHRANRLLRITGWKQLRLDLDEACGVASRYTRSAIPRADVEILQKKTGGWVAGLLLILQHGEFEEIKAYRLANHTPSEVFDYFGSVLFERLDPAMQHILIRLSHLPQISPHAAEKIAGGYSLEILEKLHADNAFTYRTVGENPTYSFHPLFQEFLQARCHNRCSPAEVRQLQSISAACLAADGATDEAVGLYLQGGQVDQALRLILALAPKLSMQGRVLTLSAWLNALPADLAETLPWLVFWRGVCTVPYNPKEGQAYFKRALATFEEQDDPVGSYLAFSGIIEAIVFAAEDYAALDIYIDKYHELHARWGAIEVGDVQIRLTNAMLMAMIMRRGNTPEIAIWIDRAWATLNELKDINTTLQLFIGLLTLQTITGEFAAARHVLDVLQEVIPDNGPILPHLFHMNLRTFYCWSVGRFEEGLASADRGMQIEADCDLRMLYTAIRTHAACAAIGLGQMELARRYLDEAASMVSLEGNWIQSLYHAMRSWYELRLGNLAGAGFHAHIHYEKALAAGSHLTMPFSHAIMAVILYESGQHDAAQEHLAMGFATSKGYTGQVFEFKGYLLKARFALAEGDEATATRMLEEGFAIGARWDYRYVNHWQPEVMAELCAEALRRDIESAYVRSLVVEHGLVPPTPPVDVPGWPWPVRITTLGRFSLEKDGIALPSPRKAQQRPLAILKYLVAAGGKSIPASKIELALWPDADGDAANNAFSTTLHRLRKLMGSDDAIRYSQGLLSFDPFLVWIDVLAFERCALQVTRTLSEPCSAAELHSLRKALVGLYLGPFLPGESAAWAIPLRERLQASFFTALSTLAHAFEERGCLEDAAQCCRYGLTLDPLVEPLYYPLMRITFQQGRKSEALQLYEQCRTLLKAELGLAPSEMLETVKNRLFT